ncbi:MAG: F0F1 ATP synthase subunit epsilon [Chitinophagaceae bacterium]
MENTLMNLKILLPFKIFIDTKNVRSITIETSEGSYGMLPQRLDCVAALVPGIFTYEIETGRPKYIAVDEGLMIKAGNEVLVSVRNAIGGADLGKLSDMIKKDFNKQDENKIQARSVMAKLEGGFIYSFDKFRKD